MPTRFVTLMNPRPRRAIRRVRRTRASRNRMGRFTSSRRRVHRNPSRRRRSAPRAVAIYRRPRRRVAHRNPPSMTPAMRKKISLAVRRSFRNRRSSSPARRVIHAVRSFRRRRSGGGGGFRGGSLVGSFKSAMSKPMLMKAGGAVLASFGTGYILNRWGASLPMAQSKYGKLAYTTGIPIVAAYFLRRKAPALAEGLVIGGLVMGINSLMQSFRVGAAAAPTPAPAAVGAYALAGELGQPGALSAYPQNMPAGAGLGGSNVAFPGSAW